jgi:hypothetical protein
MIGLPEACGVDRRRGIVQCDGDLADDLARLAGVALEALDTNLCVEDAGGVAGGAEDLDVRGAASIN